jgi:hypothetical protein
MAKNGSACASMRALLALWPGDLCQSEKKGRSYVQHSEVLVLNNNYEPLNVCNVRRAISLLMLGKADVLHHHESPILTGRGPLRVPSVLKMRYPVRRPMPQLRLSRHSILASDN